MESDSTGRQHETLTEVLYRWKAESIDYLPKLFLAVVILVITFFVAKLFRSFSLRFYKRVFKQNIHIAPVISNLVFILVWFTGLFLALEVLGLEGVLTKVLAGAGIIGVIAGFAFKDIASNAFGGFLLNMQKPFKKGDWVKVGDEFGQVREIGMITTHIANMKGEEVFVPNQMIYQRAFVNYSTRGKLRIVLETGVSYGDDLEQVKQVTLDEVGKLSTVLTTEKIDFFYTNIGDSAYQFQVRFWIRFRSQDDYLKAQSEAIMHIKKRFEQEDITIAYPVRTLEFGVKGGVNIFDKSFEINRNQ